MTSDKQVVRERLALEMLERPHLWPQQWRGMRCVFLKRPASGSAPFGEECTGPCFRVDGGYVVMQHDWANSATVTPLHYESAEAVLADGWVVD